MGQTISKQKVLYIYEQTWGEQFLDKRTLTYTNIHGANNLQCDVFLHCSGTRGGRGVSLEGSLPQGFKAWDLKAQRLERLNRSIILHKPKNRKTERSINLVHLNFERIENLVKKIGRGYPTARWPEGPEDLRMYMYIYICIYICIYTHICISIYIYIYMCVCMRTESTQNKK